MSDNPGGRRLEVGDRSFDLAIDRAARAMLDVEPPADLRAKVIARIDGKGSWVPAFSVVRFGMLIAAAAVLVLAVMLARRSEPVPQAPAVAEARDVRLPAPVGPAPNVIQTAPPARVAADSQQTRRSLTPRVPAPSFADAPKTASAIEPMGPIAPIEVAPIEQSNIRPESIAVRPLNPITEMQIEPLTPPDRRN